jgi:hypothetical protein
MKMDKTGLTNVVMGLVAVGAGLSGRYGLPGKHFELPIVNSHIGLLVLGGVIVAHGCYQIYRARPR